MNHKIFYELDQEYYLNTMNLNKFKPTLFVTIGSYHENGINTREITSKNPSKSDLIRFVDFTFGFASKEFKKSTADPETWFSGIYVFENKDLYGNKTLNHIHALIDVPDRVCGHYCRFLHKYCHEQAAKRSFFGFPIHLYPVFICGTEQYHLKKYVMKNVVSSEQLSNLTLMGDLLKNIRKREAPQKMGPLFKGLKSKGSGLVL